MAGVAGEPSARFQGQKGAVYATAQSRVAENAAILDAWKFSGHVSSDQTVVDFGCGPGALLALLPAQRRIGVEVNEPARRQATARGIETYASSAELPSAAADVVISNHALEHTLYPLIELRELHRALKPGGRLVLWLPLDDWRRQQLVRREDKDHHLYTWTPLLLGNLLLEAGFIPEDVQVVTSAWRANYVGALRRLPASLYRLLTLATAVGLRRRQLCALARRGE